jgi:hypothetical protein
MDRSLNPNDSLLGLPQSNCRRLAIMTDSALPPEATPPSNQPRHPQAAVRVIRLVLYLGLASAIGAVALAGFQFAKDKSALKNSGDRLVDRIRLTLCRRRLQERLRLRPQDRRLVRSSSGGKSREIQGRGSSDGIFRKELIDFSGHSATVARVCSNAEFWRIQLPRGRIRS